VIDKNFFSLIIYIISQIGKIARISNEQSGFGDKGRLIFWAERNKKNQIKKSMPICWISGCWISGFTVMISEKLAGARAGIFL
jgi:hypothetical protein